MPFSLCEILGKRRCSVLFLYFVILVMIHYNKEIIYEKYSLMATLRERHRSDSKMTPEQRFRSYHLADDIRKRSSTDLKIILYWLPPFGSSHPVGMEKNGCVVTYDQEAIDVAHAVVFHVSDTSDRIEWFPLQKRKPWQRWIWFSMEAPWNTRFGYNKHLTLLNGIFNWTMTYRTDSDMIASYIVEPSLINKTVKAMIAEKTADKLALWLVSNCYASAREKFVTELEKYISIEKMGKCSGKELCRGQCGFEMINRYKFYFSFENSRCKDYITEKFWVNGLQGGAVPVVMGAPRADYERVAPPNSFIHVDDFADARQLADYMKELDKDDEKYGKYLEWRSLQEHSEDTQAEERKRLLKSRNLCEKLKQGSKIPNKIIPNLDTWWYGEGYTSNSHTFDTCSPLDGASGPSSPSTLLAIYCAVLTILCFVTVMVMSRKRCGTNRM